MTLMRLIPADGPERRGSRGARRRRRWTLGLSGLLHLLLLAALLLFTRRSPPNEQAAPSYELVFEDGGGSVPSTSTDRGDSQPPAPAPPGTAVEPPQDTAESAPPPPAAVIPADPPPAATPPAEQAQALPAPPQAGPAEVRLQPPADPAPAKPLVPDLVLPTPPVPPPPPMARPVPRPAPPRPRTAPPGTFDNPMDLSFNQAPNRDARQAAPRAGAASGSVASRSLDLSLGAPKPGPNRSEAFFDARARNLGADWMQGVQQFWLRHRYYPRQAAENGEDGSVDLEITVNRQGRVQSATLKSRSGSPFIDMAAVGTFRGAQLPPLPEEVTAPYTVTITINYILLR